MILLKICKVSECWFFYSEELLVLCPILKLEGRTITKT